MPTVLTYIFNDNGHKISVLIPVKTWKALNGKYKKLKKKLSVLTGIQHGITEVKEHRSKGKSLQTSSDFLSEGNNYNKK